MIHHTKMEKKIIILGGGIAGLSTAIALKNNGIDAVVFESAPSIKPVGAGLGLAANAIKAFKELRIEEEVIAAGRFMESFTVYNQYGKTITKTDSKAVSKKYGLDNFSIHRADLHELLLSKLNPSNIRLNKKVKSFEQQADGVTVFFEDGTLYKADYVIAAEGIHSVVRKKLLPQSSTRFSGYTCWRAIIDNSSLQLNESSETWGKNGRFGIVPLKDNRIYWFACMNAAANDERMKKFTVEDLQHQFKDYHHPVPSILKQTKNEDLIWGDINDIKPIEQFAFGNILLIGDAAHATTPNLGQGGCQAIEDAVVLAEEIRDNLDIEKAFLQFEQRRLQRVHWVVNTSRQVGRVAQWENSFLIQLRNFLFRLLPKSFSDRQFQKLYKVDFGNNR
jgi:2-polyprenyl-6-methoxyphenol hydroxylase-like FAD-dependent oxidoreductase